MTLYHKMSTHRLHYIIIWVPTQRALSFISFVDLRKRNALFCVRKAKSHMLKI